MPEDIFTKLRAKVDELGVGYPATESGVEYSLLKYLFNEEQAAYFIDMKDEYETVEGFSSRTQRDPKHVAEVFESMVKQGQLLRIREGEVAKYHVMPVAHGLFELNVNNLSTAWVPDFFKHIGTNLAVSVFNNTEPFFRVIPARKDVVVDSGVLPMDDVTELINKNTVFAVAECICRAIGKMSGNPCKHGNERCLMLGDFAKFYIEEKLGREITKDEALKIVERGAADGLFIQAINSKKAECICSCCKCHCGEYAMMNLAGPDAVARPFISNYVCTIDKSKCDESCSEVCIGACGVSAFTLVDGALRYSGKACVGCGQCVLQCPSKALKLVPKAPANIFEPAEDVFDGYAKQAAYRRDHKGAN